MAELIVTLKEKVIKHIAITKLDTAIGRDAKCEVEINNPGVSRLHAVIKFRQGRFLLEDAGSSNGLYVNGRLRTTHPLEDQDKILVGKFVVIFALQGGKQAHELEHNEGLYDAGFSEIKVPVEKTTHLSLADVERLHLVQPPENQSPDDTSRTSQTWIMLGIAILCLLMLIAAIWLLRQP